MKVFPISNIEKTSDIPINDGATGVSFYIESGDNISELINDAGYLTNADIGDFLQAGDNISELVNDVGYLDKDEADLYYQPLAGLLTAITNLGQPLPEDPDKNLSWDAGSQSVIWSDKPTATDILYDNTNSGLTATNIQAAIDEVVTTSESFLTEVNLGYTPSPTDGTVTNSAGTNSIILAATSTEAGLLLPGEKDLIGTAVQPDELDDYQLRSEKGQPNGYVPLDGASKIPLQYLPDALLVYKGTWDPNINTPTLADGTGTLGDTYRIVNAPSPGVTIDLGSGPIHFQNGDYVIYNGTEWEKADGTDAVVTVNGITGIVQLDLMFNSSTGDINITGGTSPINLDSRYYTETEINDNFYTKTEADTLLDGKVDNTISILGGLGLIDGGDLTQDRTISLGTPSSTTLSSTNNVTASSHTHAFEPGGTANQYIDGTGALQDFDTSAGVNDGVLTLTTSGIATGDQTFSANQGSNSTFTVDVPGTNITQGTKTPTTVPITSSTGTGATLTAATISLAGIMSADDKAKLDDLILPSLLPGIGLSWNSINNTIELGETSGIFRRVNWTDTGIDGLLIQHHQGVGVSQLVQYEDRVYTRAVDINTPTRVFASGADGTGAIIGQATVSTETNSDFVKGLEITGDTITIFDEDGKGAVYDADYSAVGSSDPLWIPNIGYINSLLNNVTLQAATDNGNETSNILDLIPTDWIAETATAIDNASDGLILYSTINGPGVLPQGGFILKTSDPNTTEISMREDGEIIFAKGSAFASFSPTNIHFSVEARGEEATSPDGFVTLSQLGSGGAVNWGSIGGTLADQTDLQAALDNKAELSDLAPMYPLGYGNASVNFGGSVTDDINTLTGNWAGAISSSAPNKPGTGTLWTWQLLGNTSGFRLMGPTGADGELFIQRYNASTWQTPIKIATEPYVNSLGFALDSDVVHLTGNETISDTKLFSNPITTTYTTPDADGTANSGNSILSGFSRATDYASLSGTSGAPPQNTIFTVKTSDARILQIGAGTAPSTGFWYRSLHTANSGVWRRVWDSFNLPDPASNDNVIHTTGDETKNGLLTLVSGAGALNLTRTSGNQNSIRFENTSGIRFIGLGNDGNFRVGPDLNISVTGEILSTQSWANSNLFGTGTNASSTIGTAQTTNVNTLTGARALLVNPASGASNLPTDNSYAVLNLYSTTTHSPQLMLATSGSGYSDNFWYTNRSGTQKFQVAAREWVNSQGFLTSVPTLQEITTGAGNNQTTNVIQVTGGNNDSNTDGTTITNQGFIIRDGGAFAGNFVASSAGMQLTHTPSGQVLAITPQNATQAGIFTGSRIAGAAAENIGEYLNGNNAGFGLSWNDVDNVLDWGETEVLGSNTWHYLSIGSNEVFSLGDQINDGTTPYVVAAKQTQDFSAQLYSGQHTTGNTARISVVSDATSGTAEISASSGLSSKYISIDAASGGGIILADNLDNIGLTGDAYYGDNYTNLSYTQKAYVDAGDDPTPTSYQNLGLGTGVTATTARVRKKGNIVEIQLVDAEFNGEDMTLPSSDYYPNTTMYGYVYASAVGQDKVYQLTITTSGVITPWSTSAAETETLTGTIQYVIF